MAKYKEILKYRNLNFSKKQISEILSTSRNTVAKVYEAADENNLDWLKASRLDEVEITEILFPKTDKKSAYNLPDYEYVHKEQLKKGVTLKLLWEEYVLKCQQNGVTSLQYVQFCNHYRKYKVSNKATMHFTHFPGQRIEVKELACKFFRRTFGSL